MTQRAAKLNYAYFLRLFTGLVIFVFLCLSIDFGAFPKLADLSFSYFGGAIFLVFSDRLISAYRWYILINVREARVRFPEVLNIYFISNYIGLMMPSSVGGEFVKGYGLSKATGKTIDSYSSVIIERVLGLCSLLCVCGFSFYLFPELSEEINSDIRVSLSPIELFVCGLVAALLIIAGIIIKKNDKFRKLSTLIRKIFISFYEYRQEKSKVFLAGIFSVLIQIIRILFAWLIAKGLLVTADLSLFFFYIPVIALISMVPLSLAGLGIQEGAFVYFFSLNGVPSSYSLCMALIVRIMTIISVLPGGWLFIRKGL